MTSKSSSKHWSDLMRFEGSASLACPREVKRTVENRLKKTHGLLSKSGVTGIRVTSFATPIYNGHKPELYRIRSTDFDIRCTASELEVIATSIAQDPAAPLPVAMHDKEWTQTAHDAWQLWLRIESGMSKAAVQWGLR